jgi:nucleotide-binding universal stress UspA family protein
MSGMPEHADQAQPVGQGSGAPVSSVVVVGIDGSATSWDAFWWACGETRRLSGRVVAVFVGPTLAARAAASTAPLGASFIALGVIEQTENEQASQLSQEACRYAADHAIEFTFVHAHGDTAQELLRVAVGARADLIVVGRSAKARHHIAGSLGRRLTRNHKAPIIVVVP